MSIMAHISLNELRIEMNLRLDEEVHINRGLPAIEVGVHFPNQEVRIRGGLLAVAKGRHFPKRRSLCRTRFAKGEAYVKHSEIAQTK
jgi:hypothetical protein